MELGQNVYCSGLYICYFGTFPEHKYTRCTVADIAVAVQDALHLVPCMCSLNCFIGDKLMRQDFFKLDLDLTK